MKKKTISRIIVLVFLLLVHNFLATNLSVIENRGISFGWLSLPTIVYVVFLFLVYRVSGWSMVFVGGVVNFIDRLRFSYVRDYWLIPGTSVYNNINDWVIFIGLFVFLINDKKDKSNF